MTVPSPTPRRRWLPLLLLSLFVAPAAIGCASSGDFDQLVQRVDRMEAQQSGQIASNQQRLDAVESGLETQDQELRQELQASRNQILADLATRLGEMDRKYETFAANANEFKQLTDGIRNIQRSNYEIYRGLIQLLESMLNNADREVTEIQAAQRRMRLIIADLQAVLQTLRDVTPPEGTEPDETNGNDGTSE